MVPPTAVKLRDESFYKFLIVEIGNGSVTNFQSICLEYEMVPLAGDLNISILLYTAIDAIVN